MNDQTMAILAAFLAGIIAGLYLAFRFALLPAGRQYRQIKRYDQVVQLTVTSPDHRQGWFLELTESQINRLRILARAVASGRELTGAAWSGRGKLFTRSEFEMLVQLMITYGWARWVHPEYHNQGLDVTPAGLAAFRFLAGIKAIPSPTDLASELFGLSTTDAHTHAHTGQ